MITDFRALCANLTAALNDWQCETGDDRYAALITSARIALPQPEPAATGGEFATTAEYALLELRGVVVDLCDAERWIAAERLEKVIDILGRHHALPTPDATNV